MKIRLRRLLVILLAFGFIGVVTADLKLDDLELRLVSVTVLPAGPTSRPQPPTAPTPPSVRPAGSSSTSTTSTMTTSKPTTTTTTTTTTTRRPSTTTTTTTTTRPTTSTTTTSPRPSRSTRRSSTSTSTTPSTPDPGDCTDDEDESGPRCHSPPRPGQGGPGGDHGDGGGRGQGPPTGRRKRREVEDNRNRRTPTPSDVIQNRLNDIRRKKMAADMYYATWDPVLAQASSDLTASCDPRLVASVRHQLRAAQGLVGLLPESYGVQDALQVIVDQFDEVHHSFYDEIMSSHLLAFGCNIGAYCGSNVNRRRRSSDHKNVFACVFAYSSRPPAPGQPFRPGPVCSMCNSTLDALWCDQGLCRNCKPEDPSCDMTCHDVCSSCDTVASDDRCKCLCYYDNNMARCQEHSARASRDQPVCGARPPPPSVTVLGISITVGVSFVLIVLTIIIACCLRRIRVQQRRRNSQSSAPRPPGDVVGTDDDPSIADLAASTVIILPPPYNEIENEPKPPPYSSVFVVPATAACPSYQSAIAGVGGSVSARDRSTGTGSRNRPPRPPRRTGSGSGSARSDSSSSRTPPLRTNIHDVTVAFDNNAYTSSRYLPQEEDA